MVSVMKIVMAIFAAMIALADAGFSILRVKAVSWESNSPIGSVLVEVDSPTGNRVSAFTSARGIAEFRLREGEYMVIARENSISHCGMPSRGRGPLCAGTTRVSIGAATGPTDATVVLRPPILP